MPTPDNASVPPASDTQAPAPWRVICLCAQWCGVCREWRSAFDRLAGEHPQVQFAWVDVEDEDEAMGDVEIETFPTVLVAQGSQARLLAPVPPSAQGLAQLLARLQARPEASPAPNPQADPLLQRLMSVLPPFG